MPQLRSPSHKPSSPPPTPHAPRIRAVHSTLVTSSPPIPGGNPHTANSCAPHQSASRPASRATIAPHGHSAILYSRMQSPLAKIRSAPPVPCPRQTECELLHGLNRIGRRRFSVPPPIKLVSPLGRIHKRQARPNVASPSDSPNPREQPSAFPVRISPNRLAYPPLPAYSTITGNLALDFHSGGK